MHFDFEWFFLSLYLVKSFSLPLSQSESLEKDLDWNFLKSCNKPVEMKIFFTWTFKLMSSKNHNLWGRIDHHHQPAWWGWKREESCFKKHWKGLERDRKMLERKRKIWEREGMRERESAWTDEWIFSVLDYEVIFYEPNEARESQKKKSKDISRHSSANFCFSPFNFLPDFSPSSSSCLSLSLFLFLSLFLTLCSINLLRFIHLHPSETQQHLSFDWFFLMHKNIRMNRDRETRERERRERERDVRKINDREERGGNIWKEDGFTSQKFQNPPTLLFLLAMIQM